MTKYNYYEAMKEDIKDYIADNYTEEEIKERITENREEWAEELCDEMWTADSVTGNASGSYTFSAYRAEENICHNLDLLGEALQEFCCGPDYLINNGVEACDVTIRCYLLSQVLAEVFDELEEEKQ